MFDPLSVMAISTLIVKSAHLWLPPIRDAFFSKAQDKGLDLIFDTGIENPRVAQREKN